MPGELLCMVFRDLEYIADGRVLLRGARPECAVGTGGALGAVYSFIRFIHLRRVCSLVVG